MSQIEESLKIRNQDYINLCAEIGDLQTTICFMQKDLEQKQSKALFILKELRHAIEINPDPRVE